jgi:hypothetical protein
VRRAAPQSIPHSTLTTLVFDTEINDTNSCWSSSNPTRLYAQSSGYYIAGGGWGNFEGLSGFIMNVQIKKNGNRWLASQDVYRGLPWGATVQVSTGMLHMNAGDYIEIIVLHGRGTSMSTAWTSNSDDRGGNGWLIRIP